MFKTVRRQVKTIRKAVVRDSDYKDEKVLQILDKNSNVICKMLANKLEISRIPSYNFTSLFMQGVFLLCFLQLRKKSGIITSKNSRKNWVMRPGILTKFVEKRQKFCLEMIIVYQKLKLVFLGLRERGCILETVHPQ